MSIKTKNLSNKADIESSVEETRKINRFIESIKSDIIVIKTKGGNDANIRDEITKKF
ncbi:hypothetical protein [Enterococcus sp. AZ012]|uniref:hypothetical protein n=1 Tax=unclassified Enterococcus TaxID=2608891 RepID=UPI003D28B690